MGRLNELVKVMSVRLILKELVEELKATNSMNDFEEKFLILKTELLSRGILISLHTPLTDYEFVDVNSENIRDSKYVFVIEIKNKNYEYEFLIGIY